MAVRTYMDGRVLGSRNADPDEVHAGRRPRLSGSEPAYHGNFYALPQSPSFQTDADDFRLRKVLPDRACFRDEDLRADRQPEFTQVDIEMSFPSREALFSMIEGMMVDGVRTEGIQISDAAPRMSFEDAMDSMAATSPTRVSTSFFRISPLSSRRPSRCISGDGGGGQYHSRVGCARRLVFPQTVRRPYHYVKQMGGAGVAWIKLGDDGLSCTRC